MMEQLERDTGRRAAPLSTADALGRTLTIRRPTALDTLRLFKAAGPVLSQNEAWLAIASLASCVEAIDGIPVPAPANEIQIEALVAKLDSAGLEAVEKLLERAEQPRLGEEHVGNLQGTLSS